MSWAGAAQLRVLLLPGSPCGYRKEKDRACKRKGVVGCGQSGRTGEKAGVGVDRPAPFPTRLQWRAGPAPSFFSWTEDGTWAGRERRSWRWTSPRQRVNGLSGPWPMLLVVDRPCRQPRAVPRRARQVKAMVMPRHKDVTSEDVEKWLLELHESCLIIWHKVAGLRYVQFPDRDWKRHQRLTGKHESFQ